MHISTSTLLLVSSGLLGQSEASRPPKNPQECCNLLNQKFQGQGKVIMQSHPNYAGLNVHWLAASQLSPTCIFSPKTARDVSKAVALFSNYRCVFAIRGGSHMPNKGFSSTNNGVLVSLRDLNEISYNRHQHTVKVGAGNRWTNVYDHLDPKGVAVVGARDADVGVSGFLLGGGISFLSNKYGWAADNVVEYEVVLANGDIVHANKYQHVDLMGCLRGGSSNFGIVTSFTLKTYNIYAHAAGPVRYNASYVPQLFAPLYNYIATGQDADPNFHIIPNFIKNPGQPHRAIFITFYTKEVDLSNPPAVMKPWVDGSIPSYNNSLVNRTGVGSLPKYFAGTGGASLPFRSQWHVTSVLADEQLFRTIHALWLNVSAPFEASIPGFSNSLAMQPIGRKYIHTTNTAPGRNVLGIKRPLVIVSANIYWDNESDDATMNTFLLDLFAQIKAAAAAVGKLAGYEYLNYGAITQDPISSYGNDNLIRLRWAKRRYDPCNVFGTLVEGGYKIPGAHVDPLRCRFHH
ncbi:hypothetical protein TWF506_000094 [Arthrobotrys conoides]|uniref:FAD-binding PCMH-type domain-containing protein n=1 Tax=Arthrobotrys conoides TaxID=74498 RepID=A0AAN8NV72_9PEZI